MKYKEVIDLTKLCIKTYNPITHSVDSHFDTFIRQHKLTDLNQMVFIKKIFYGIERYEPLMTVIYFSLGYTRRYEKQNTL